MPTSSISGIVSTSVYFAAVLLLMVAVMAPAVTLYRGSSLEAAARLAHGIAAQIDDLSPGMRSAIEFGSYPGMEVAVTLSGANVTATVNGLSATQAVNKQLVTSTLMPGEVYEVVLAGGVVTVA
jgi:hypothetical protein